MITMLRKIKPESRTSGVSYNKILNLEHQAFERERYKRKDPPHRRKNGHAVAQRGNPRLTRRWAWAGGPSRSELAQAPQGT